jgi:glycosyltransferase involved in cell wall biosynthesis
LKLVFEKQRQAVAHSSRLILPSRAMVDTLSRCYRRRGAADVSERALVVPWGGWAEAVDPQAVRRRAEDLKKHYQLGSKTRVLMTLSRLSPEKGVHLLLEALRRMEASGTAPEDMCLFVCGEAAFMGGAAYERRLRRLAGRLKRLRIFFPGYVAGVEKHAFFSLAELFLSPSIHDSYGLTVVEALRAGLGVLASDHHGVHEIFAQDKATDPQAGFGRTVSYAAGDREAALQEELCLLLADPARLKAMGERARRAGAGMDFPEAARKVAAAALELV